MHKTLILTLMAVVAAASGCTSMLLGNGQSAGRPIGTETRTQATVSSDRRISAIILNRYAADGDLAGQGLRVSTRQGVVTLTGGLDSYALRDRAARLASDVEGVQRVNNQIAIGR